MNSNTVFFPILLIVGSNVVYNISTKATPSGANAAASLVITYVVAAICAFLLLLIQTKEFSFSYFKEVHWSAILLAVSIVFLEIGYILAYRAGWNISACSLVANIILAMILVIIGVFFYHESLSLKQVSGMALCLGGLVLLNLK